MMLLVLFVRIRAKEKPCAQPGSNTSQNISTWVTVHVCVPGYLAHIFLQELDTGSKTTKSHWLFRVKLLKLVKVTGSFDLAVGSPWIRRKGTRVCTCKTLCGGVAILARSSCRVQVPTVAVVPGYPVPGCPGTFVDPFVCMPGVPGPGYP
eukprot:3414959-Rhodomonas_salina.1